MLALLPPHGSHTFLVCAFTVPCDFSAGTGVHVSMALLPHEHGIDMLGSLSASLPCCSFQRPAG
jgi:hypothetical protein